MIMAGKAAALNDDKNSVKKIVNFVMGQSQ